MSYNLHTADRMPEDESLPKKVRLSDGDLKNLSQEELLKRWKQEDAYVKMLERKYSDLIFNGMTNMNESEEKLKRQQRNAAWREKNLVMRLATKEQEVQKRSMQIQYLNRAPRRSLTQLQASVVDPTVNSFFHKMRCELDQIKTKLEQAQNELGAWKFTPDSQTGKKLMAKCRMLVQENQELGRQLSQGRIAQLEAELALQKKYSDELKSSQDELNEFIIQLDEEVEGMQSTILALQQQLKEARQELAQCSAAMSATPEPPEPACNKDSGRRVTNGPGSSSPVQKNTSSPLGEIGSSITDQRYVTSSFSKGRPTCSAHLGVVNQLCDTCETVASPADSEPLLTQDSTDSDQMNQNCRTADSHHVRNRSNFTA